MKKLIAISVVFALVAGAAFAVDLGATVIGTVDVLKGDTNKNADGESTKVTSAGTMNRIRIDGSGEANENFGGFFRYSDGGYYGNAWWKPIEQFKLLIGSNGYDGFIGKEGVTGWGFHQTVTDTGIAHGGAGVWAKDIYGYGISTRSAFFEGGGDGGNAAYLFITPMDILAVNIILPFFNGGETADVFKKTVAQIDLKLDFGNIALTYVGGRGNKDPSSDYVPGTDPKDATIVQGPDGGKAYFDGTVWQPITDAVGEAGYSEPMQIFAYYGGSFGDLSIDFGFGFTTASKVEGKSYANPIGVGLGVKYATDAFGVKLRTVANLGGDDKKTKILVDLLPYFSLADNLTAFVSVGIGMQMGDGVKAETGGDTSSQMGWQFNPYLQVGEEWGAKFLAGIKVWSDGKKQYGEKGDATMLNWGVPIALIVSF